MCIRDRLLTQNLYFHNLNLNYIVFEFYNINIKNFHLFHFNNLAISGTISYGSKSGVQYFSTFPSPFNKNLAKFQVIFLVNLFFFNSGDYVLKYQQTSQVSLPLTCVLANNLYLASNFSVKNFLIIGLGSGSQAPNQLQGNTKISNPQFENFV
eukprot:TRINITY_DN1378_c0_g1_i5.p1 TRINITY_DN1378_c0_g1~~TRINITY_DN1378_c0_g1_i5.p1  ORF type:complete len:153 (+),score=0.79 TRINITY_DN1378_c0_g1_i5:74-532(+)